MSKVREESEKFLKELKQLQEERSIRERAEDVTRAEHDPVKNPAHYTQGQIETWDYIVDQGLCYLAGCVIKYVVRYRWKGTPLQDLRKARAYLDRLIRQVEEEGGGQ